MHRVVLLANNLNRIEGSTFSIEETSLSKSKIKKKFEVWNRLKHRLFNKRYCQLVFQSSFLMSNVLPQSSGRWGCFFSHSLMAARSLSRVVTSSFSSTRMLFHSSPAGWTSSSCFNFIFYLELRKHFGLELICLVFDKQKILVRTLFKWMSIFITII